MEEGLFSDYTKVQEVGQNCPYGDFGPVDELKQSEAYRVLNKGFDLPTSSMKLVKKDWNGQYYGKTEVDIPMNDHKAPEPLRFNFDWQLGATKRLDSRVFSAKWKNKEQELSCWVDWGYNLPLKRFSSYSQFSLTKDGKKFHSATGLIYKNPNCWLLGGKIQWMFEFQRGFGYRNFAEKFSFDHNRFSINSFTVTNLHTLTAQYQNILTLKPFQGFEVSLTHKNLAKETTLADFTTQDDLRVSYKPLKGLTIGLEWLDFFIYEAIPPYVRFDQLQRPNVGLEWGPQGGSTKFKAKYDMNCQNLKFLMKKAVSPQIRVSLFCGFTIPQLKETTFESIKDYEMWPIGVLPFGIKYEYRDQ